MPQPNPPAWVRDAIFYQIFPDRFARSESVDKPSGLAPWGAVPTPHGYQGGDLIGVAERLDYLSELGINAIYFTPIFQSASNHRYHTHDYEKVDPMLGGDLALRRLIDEAHARGIRVVLDGVFNHASRGFFQFNDILENGPNSAYLDWFTVSDFPLRAYDSETPPNYNAWWGLPALPKFNIQTPAVRKFLFSIAKKWVDFGIDGWRLDVANEIDDDDFWREFRDIVRSSNPDCYIVGEVWHDARHWLQGDMWDAVMNYLFTRACIAFFPAVQNMEVLHGTTLAKSAPRGAREFRESIEQLLALYHPDVTAAQLNLLDSHDMARFVSIAAEDTSAFRLATLFQMTYPGVPSIYYGDEIGISGGHDPLNRASFPWQQPEAWDRDLLNDVRRMIGLRNANPVFRGGRFGFVDVFNDQDDVTAYVRTLEDALGLVVINQGSEPRQVTLDLAGRIPPGVELREVWVEGDLSVVDSKVKLLLKPRSGRVFLTKAGPNV